MDLLDKIEAQIIDGLAQAAGAAKDQGELSFTALPDFVLEKPREKAHGDYASNLAMLLVKEAKMSPRDIAQVLVKHFPASTPYVSDVQVAGPGFINLTLDESWLEKVIPAVFNEGKDYGRTDKGRGKKVQVEFVSANPTGIPHMGNARGAALGDTIASLLDWAGYQVEREYYVNDAGNQIDRFARSLDARFHELCGKEMDFPEDGYLGEDLLQTMDHFIKEEGEELLDVEEAVRQEKLVAYALKEKIDTIKKDLARFGVHYDRWFYESTLYEEGAIDRVMDILDKAGYIYEKEGAVWLAASRLGQDKDEVMVRKNGTPTYFAADIAYHQNKYDRGFETLINVWGADHHGHVARMQKTMGALGHDPGSLEVVLMQLVRLVRRKETVKMSKRSGQYVSLGELMDEVGVDAARYFFVMRSADSQMDFDLDLAKEESNENPVFYVQYAHARIASILRQKKVSSLEDVSLSLLKEPAEKDLLEILASFPQLIARAAEGREPHRLCTYAHQLASAFHHFYGKHRVLKIDEDLSLARLALLEATRTTLANVLTLIGVDAPDKM